jgi:hypothetical protein
MRSVLLLLAAAPAWAVQVYTVCPSGCTYPDPATAEAALPTIFASTWPQITDTVILEWTAGQNFNTSIGLPYINNSQAYFACTETQGSANLSCPRYYDPASGVTITAGMPVSGPGVSSGVTVNSVSGSGPYTVRLSSAPTPPSPLCTLSPGSQTCTQTVALHFGGAHWVIHRSSECYEFPSGTRAGPVNTTTGTGVYSAMAKLTGPANTLSIGSSAPGVSYHRFECLEIADSTATNGEPYYAVGLFYQPAGAPGSAEHQISDLVHHVVFDRDYIHHYVDSNQNSAMQTTFSADSGYLEITNSTLMHFHPTAEGHAYGASAAIGPLYFRNNEFESSQIGTLLGGGGSALGGAKATGSKFLGNYYYRPWLWRVTSGTVLPTNAFYPSNCMYDSNGGESYIDVTNGHWYLCNGGTWADQGAGTPSIPYCQTAACRIGGAVDAVCTSATNSTMVTCNDTTGIQVGMIVQGPPAFLYGGTNSVAAVPSGTTVTLSSPASWAEQASVFFYNSNGASPFYCTAGCSIDKNQWECKECFATVVEGNWIQNGWQPAMLGQAGNCMLLNWANNYYAPDTVESWTTITNNRCDSNAGGLIEASVGGPYSWQPVGLKFSNNLFTNIGLPQTVGPGIATPSNSALLLDLGTFKDTAFDHNTLLLNNSVDEGLMGLGAWFCGGSGVPGFISWTNSILNGGYGMWLADCANSYAGYGFTPNGLYYQAPTSNFSNDLVITNQSPCVPNGSGGNCGQYQFSTNPCNGCQYPTTLSSLFQAYPTNLAVSSTYQGTGYLGTDPGADIQVVNWSTQGAVSGARNPFLDFRVRSLLVSGTTATYYYTAPDTGACTLSVANNSGYNSPVYKSSDNGGNPDRSLTVTGLSPYTRYWYSLVCGASNYRRSDVFITKHP